MKNFRKLNRGSAFLMILVYLLVMGSITAILMKHSIYQRRANARFSMHQEEVNAAEYALNKMISEIIYLGTFRPQQVGGDIENFHAGVLNIQPPSIEGYEFSDSSVECVLGEDLAFDTIEESSHEWYGYPALRIVYNIRVRAKKTGGRADDLVHPGIMLERRVEVLSIPLYVFGIFYQNILEIWPGPQFDMHGRVHSNTDLWLGAGSRANYWERITSSGDVYNGRHPLSGKSGTSDDVYIYDGDELKNMVYEGDFLDSQHDDWMNLALDRWDDHLRDSAHGIRDLRLPIPSYEDPYALIERADPENDGPALQDIKFEYKSDLKIIRDPETGVLRGYDSSGEEVPLSYPDPENPEETKYVYDESLIYNNREDKYVRMLDLDIEKLAESGVEMGNGMIYLSEESNTIVHDGNMYETQPGVRIVNGEQLPETLSGSMTIATDNPIYVQGDFNVGDDRIPALVAGDSINILSNSWSDAQNVDYRHSLHSASSTETNAIFMGGNVPSGYYDGSSYSGGAENYFRYLESWSGRTHTFRGSMLNLWESRIANGEWIYGGRYYQAPNRDWYWDDVLGGINPPPGMLSFFQVNPLEWRIVSSTEVNNS